MSSSIAHLMTFAKETNFDPMDREGPIKHLEAYMNQTTEDAITKNENRYKHLVGFLKNNLNDMPKGMKEKLKDILVMNNFIEVESLDPEPTVKAAKGKGKAKEVCPCGVLTKSKKPCKKNGLPEFGGKCKQHKDEQAPARVVAVETKVVVEEASTSKHEEDYELSDEDAKILKEMKHYEENDEEDMEEYEEIDEIEFDNYEMN
jgi:hypothetical protein